MNLKKILIFIILFIPSFLNSQELWEQHKGNCDSIFRGYESAKISELKLCVNIWEAYRNIQRIKEEERLAVARALQRLYKDGDEEGKHIAKNALARIGFPPPPEEEKKLEEKKEKKIRKKYVPAEATKKEKKLAINYRMKGMKFYRKGKYENAISNFEKAIELYPGYVQAIYDSACTYSLMGNGEMAIEYLARLLDIGTKDAMNKVYKARNDNDFSPIKENPEFKRLTGYSEIKLLNGLKEEYKEYAEQELYRIELYLKKLNLTNITKDNDKHVRERPHIWFKEHSKHQAYVILKIVDHPKTVLVPIDWDSKFDIIISWADKVEKTSDGEVVMKYSSKKKREFDEKTIDKEMDSILHEQDQVLKKPDEYARKTESVVTTPDRAVGKVESAVDRVKRTEKTIERALDKTGSIFK